MTHKLTYQQTGGAYYLIEFEFDSECENSLHVYQYEDEFVHVLEGTNEIKLRDQKLQAVLGGVAHLPKQVLHPLYNPLKTGLRHLRIAAPGGMEIFFDELCEAEIAGTLEDTTHKRISQKYGIE